MEAIRYVMQNFRLSEEVLSLLEDFQCMVNDCIRIGLREEVTSMRSLSLKAFHQLSDYNVPTATTQCRSARRRVC